MLETRQVLADCHRADAQLESDIVNRCAAGAFEKAQNAHPGRRSLGGHRLPPRSPHAGINHARAYPHRPSTRAILYPAVRCPSTGFETKRLTNEIGGLYPVTSDLGRE